MSAWILIRERPPEECVPVLVVSNTGRMVVATYYGVEIGWSRIASPRSKSAAITHWRPLPPGPMTPSQSRLRQLRKIRESAPGYVLKLSTRSHNCLKAERINTLHDLCDMTKTDLLKIPNLGKRSLDEIVGALKLKGLTLRRT